MGEVESLRCPYAPASLRVHLPLFLLLAMLAALVCATPGYGQARLQLAEVWSLDGPAPGDGFGAVSGVVEVRPGLTVISDEMNRSLYAYDEGARRGWRLARTGDGPGEVRLPTLLTRTHDGGFAVLDLNGPLVIRFNRELREVGRVRLQGRVTNPKGFAVSPDGTVVVGGGMFGSEHGLHFFAPDGRRVAGAAPTPLTRHPNEGLHIGGGPVRMVGRDSVVYSSAAFHSISLYPVRGAPTARLVAQDPSAFPSIVNQFVTVSRESGRQTFAYAWYHPQSRGVYPLPGGGLLNVITRSDQGDSLWEVWTRGGELRSRTLVRRGYRPFDQAENGDVLAVHFSPETLEHIVVRLRVTVRE
jgi:hypothetical protein